MSKNSIISEDMKKIIVVLGMHRSGTSAVAYGLNALNVSLGEKLLPAESENNDKGFFEDIDIVQLNEHLLSELNLSWDSLAEISDEKFKNLNISKIYFSAVQIVRERIKNNSIYGMKDPRMCRLLPFWKKVFQHVGVNVSYVIVVRNPMSVADSLKKRDLFSSVKSYQLWQSHMINAVLGSQGSTRMVVNYDALIDDPVGQITRISNCLQLPLRFNEMKEFCENFLEDNLRHSKYEVKDLQLDLSVPFDVVESYSNLIAVSKDDKLLDDVGLINEFNIFSKRLEVLTPNIIRHLIENDAKVTVLQQNNKHANQLENAVEEVKNHNNLLLQAIEDNKAHIVRLEAAVVSVQHSNNDFSEKNKILSQAASENLEKNKQLELEISKLKDENQALSQSKDINYQTIFGNKKQIDHLETNFLEVQQQNQSLAQANRLLSSTIEGNNKHIGQLEAAVTEVQQHNKSLAQTNELLLSTIEGKKRHIGQLEAAVHEVQQHNQSLTQTNGLLSSTIDGNKKHIGQLEAAVYEVQQHNQSLTQTNGLLSSTIDGNKKHISQLEAAVHEVQQHNQSLTQTNGLLSSTIDGNKKHIGQLEATVFEVQHQNQLLAQKNVSLSSAIEEVKVHIVQLEATMQEVQQQNQLLTQSNESLSSTNAENKSQISHLEATVLELRQQNQSLNQANSSLSSKVDGNLKQIDQLKLAAIEAQRHNQSLVQTNELLSQTVAQKVEQSLKDHDAIAALTATKTALTLDKAAMKTKANSLAVAKGGLRVKINSLEIAKAGSDAHIAALFQNRASLEANVNYLANAKAVLEAQYNDLAADRARLEIQTNLLAAERNRVNEHAHRLATSVHDLTASLSWKITAPLRAVGSWGSGLVGAYRVGSKTLSLGGGVSGTVALTFTVLRNEGLKGIQWRLANARRLTQSPVLISEENRVAVDHVPASPVIESVYEPAYTPVYEPPSVPVSEPVPPPQNLPAPPNNDYGAWVQQFDTIGPELRQKIRDRIATFARQPLISVVMPVYNPSVEWLKEVIESVRLQLYPHWELCIADDLSTDPEVRQTLEHYQVVDSRIKVVFREKNGHISAASNSAIELATGEWIALLDHDDLLAEHALFWNVEAILRHPTAGLLYSDEDKIDPTGRRYDPYFKPDWNADLFLSHNMICHLGVYRADLVRALGGFRLGYEGSQDYDLALRVTERLDPSQIIHIPRVLYHWRSHPGSTALAGSEKNYALLAGESALKDHCKRANIAANVMLLDFGMYRIQYEVPKPEPLVSLIVPTRNGLELVKQCVDSVFNKTTYVNFEIVIVDNNSDDPAALNYFAQLAKNPKIKVIRDDRPFNYSALNNSAVRQCSGDYIGLVNNDIEVISPEWLTEMVGLASQPGVGAVGARLWYPNDTLQHGGVVTGLGGVAGHSHKYLPKGAPGYFYRAQLIQSMSAVTAACLIIKRSIFEEVGGLDEVNLTIAFNDVDFCLRVRDAGYRNVWTPYAELYHHESASRGHENTPEKQLRFSNEMAFMKERWGEEMAIDPAYSPNLTLNYEDFSYGWPPRVPAV